MPRRLLTTISLLTTLPVLAQPLPGAAPLEFDGNPGLAMVEGIHAWLDCATAASVENRAQYWRRDLSSPEAYEASIAENRARLEAYIGASRSPTSDHPDYGFYSGCVANGACESSRFRWEPWPGVTCEGRIFKPTTVTRAVVILLGDATPGREAFWAHEWAASGCMVIVPTLISREDTVSGNPAVRMTNQPHREFIYRAGFDLGRHVIGFELQMVRSLLDGVDAFWGLPLGVVGYGEGGLLALYAAALDTRIDAALVSGYFGPREGLHAEPIYRNVWRLLREFGDAEIASMIAPRKLFVEASQYPKVDGPPPERDGRHGAAPGTIETSDMLAVHREVERARGFVEGLTSEPWLDFHVPRDGQPCGDATLQAFFDSFTLEYEGGVTLGLDPTAKHHPADYPDKSPKIEHTEVQGLTDRIQQVMRACSETREQFWSRADESSAETFMASTKWYRDFFYKEVIGKLPDPDVPMNPRTRFAFETDAYTGYEVMLDVYDEIFCYGLLLIPKGIPEGERRPVVVCQHGLEGTPQMVAAPSIDHPAYKQFGCRLAEEGYVVYAPQNPYIGGNRFRQIQRKANPLGYTLFSFIVRQHERHLAWLKSLPFVDGDRIGFYGLSYGGKTAMRVPAILDDYALSICSGDFNEWIWKICSVDVPFSYMFTGEYEMLEWDLGNTFNYAEMSWLIFPRPFMVERGHDDGVGIDEWVAYEYARTRRLYVKLGYGDRTRIEFFNGPHEINGKGTFAFLREHLWDQ